MVMVRVQFSLASVNNIKTIGPWMHYLPKWKVMTSKFCAISPTDQWETYLSPSDYRLFYFFSSWLDLKWTDPRTYNDNKEERVLIFIFFFLKVSDFFSFFFNKHLVVMLSLCVWRFVVDQKEKYWANHSWRWASGESMAESFVSGGLQGAGAKSRANRKKKKIKEKRNKSEQGQEFVLQRKKQKQKKITLWVNYSGSSTCFSAVWLLNQTQKWIAENPPPSPQDSQA